MSLHFSTIPPLPIGKLPMISISHAPPPMRSAAERYSFMPPAIEGPRPPPLPTNPSIPPPSLEVPVALIEERASYFVAPDSTQDMIPVVDFEDTVKGVFVATHEQVPVGARVKLWVDEGIEVEGIVAFHREGSDDAWPGIGVKLSSEGAETVCMFVNCRHTFFYPIDDVA